MQIEIPERVTHMAVGDHQIVPYECVLRIPAAQAFEHRNSTPIAGQRCILPSAVCFHVSDPRGELRQTELGVPVVRAGLRCQMHQAATRRSFGFGRV